MKIEYLIWLDEIVEKLFTKHKVTQDEVKELITNRPYFRFVEKGHRPKENVYTVMGKTHNGRHLIAFFIYKQDRSVIILSARDMTKSERKRCQQPCAKSTGRENSSRPC